MITHLYLYYHYYDPLHVLVHARHFGKHFVKLSLILTKPLKVGFIPHFFR